MNDLKQLLPTSGFLTVNEGCQNHRFLSPIKFYLLFYLLHERSYTMCEHIFLGYPDPPLHTIKHCWQYVWKCMHGARIWWAWAPRSIAAAFSFLNKKHEKKEKRKKEKNRITYAYVNIPHKVDECCVLQNLVFFFVHYLCTRTLPICFGNISITHLTLLHSPDDDCAPIFHTSLECYLYLLYSLYKYTNTYIAYIHGCGAHGTWFWNFCLGNGVQRAPVHSKDKSHVSA